MRLRGIDTVAWQLCTDTIDLGFALSQLGHMVLDVGSWTEMLAKITATVQIKVRRELVNPLKRSHTSWKGTQLGSSCRDGIMVRSKHRQTVHFGPRVSKHRHLLDDADYSQQSQSSEDRKHPHLSCSDHFSHVMLLELADKNEGTGNKSGREHVLHRSPPAP